MPGGSDVAGWAVTLPAEMMSGRKPRTIVEVGDDATEESIWRYALGWPTRGEVKDAIARGARAFPIRLVEVERV